MRNYLEEPEFDGFDGIEDLCKAYEITSMDGTPLLCRYQYGSYEGESDCWFDKDGQLMYNYATHCSCYELEGRWEPETYIPAQFARRGSFCYSPSKDFIDWVLATYDENGRRKETND